MKLSFFYKLSKSVVPMVLLTLSVGWCYAWSLFAGPIADCLVVSKTAVLFIFCLNIFFLGMGAAFFGDFVERNIKHAALLSTGLLSAGFLLSAYGLHMHQLWLLYLGSGVFCGLAQGIAYVTSPKNLLLWWNKTKYKATIMSLSIICFGLGSSLCSVMFNCLLPSLGIEKLMVAFSVIYTSAMLLAVKLISKPKFAASKIKKSKPFDVKSALADSKFWKLWTFMFLNISAGLILIGNCASILKTSLVSATLVITVMFICGIANGLGRLVFPFIGDFMKKKTVICLLILGIELCLVIPTMFISSAVPLMVILVNACYGAAFAVLPMLILEIFGKDKLTNMHSLVLSAWGIASLFAYFCTTLLHACNVGMLGILTCIVVMYAIDFINVLTICKK